MLDEHARPYVVEGDEAAAEALEETVLVVKRREVSVFFHPAAERALRPVLLAAAAPSNVQRREQFAIPLVFESGLRKATRPVRVFLYSRSSKSDL